MDSTHFQNYLGQHLFLPPPLIHVFVIVRFVFHNLHSMLRSVSILNVLFKFASLKSTWSVIKSMSFDKCNKWSVNHLYTFAFSRFIQVIYFALYKFWPRNWSTSSKLVTSSWLVVLFHSTILLLIFCLFDISITDREVFKAPTIIVNLSTSPFSFVSFCLMYIHALLLGAMSSWVLICNVPYYPWTFLYFVVSFVWN